jgi:hypothetical protein
MTVMGTGDPAERDAGANSAPQGAKRFPEFLAREMDAGVRDIYAHRRPPAVWPASR